MAFNIAVGWAQYKLTGGLRRLFVITVGYIAIAVALMVFLTQMDYRPSLASLAHYQPLFIVVQMFVLLLWGTMRVSQAVRLDVTSGVIESHRLMPVTPLSAILGYLFGSTIQVLAVFAVNIVLGGVCSTAANTPLQFWLTANAVMLLYGITVWMVVIFFSFRLGPAGLCMLAVQLGLLITQASREFSIPGLEIIAGPIFTESLMRMDRFDTVELHLFIGCVLQALIAGVYLIAASRRYGQDRQIAFEWTLSLLLLVIWILACIAGIAAPQVNLNRFQYYNRPDAVSMFVLSMSAVGLLGILPIASAVRSMKKSPIMMAFSVAALSCLMFIVAPQPVNHLALRFTYTAVEMLAFCISLRYLFGFAIARKVPGWLLVGIWLFVFWIFPTMIDAIVTMGVPYSQHRTIFTWSPIISLPAALYAAWHPTTRILDSQAWGGPVAQLLFAALAAMIFHATRGASKKKTLVPATPPPLAQAPADLIAN